MQHKYGQSHYIDLTVFWGLHVDGDSMIMTPDFSYLMLFGALNRSIIGHLGYRHELLSLNMIKIGE